MAAFHIPKLTEAEERRILALLKLAAAGEIPLSAIRQRTGRSFAVLSKIAEKYGVSLK